MVDCGRRAGVQEIEITDEMVAAGLRALLDSGFREWPETETAGDRLVIKRVLRAGLGAMAKPADKSP
jgi:hypothetical protein